MSDAAVWGLSARIDVGYDVSLCLGRGCSISDMVLVEKSFFLFFLLFSPFFFFVTGVASLEL